MSDLNWQLNMAIAYNNAPKVHELIEKGVWVGADDNMALMGAAHHHGNTEIIKALLDKGADPTAAYSRPVTNAVEGGHFEATKLLLEHGGNANARGNNPIRSAIFQSDIPMIELLEKHGVDIRQENDDMLAFAANKARPDMVRYLAGRGLDVYADDCKAFKACVGSYKVSDNEKEQQNYEQKRLETLQVFLIELKMEITPELQEWIDKQQDPILKRVVEKIEFYKRMEQKHPPRQAQKKSMSMKI